MRKVSILVPVYNVSAYIEQCARSLFEQTFDDIEYIFVDDDTPDDSIKRLQSVMEQYPERDVKIISHECNQGLAVARKTALLAASGEYVCCVDSDDYVEPDMVAVLYSRATEDQVDIVVSDALFEYSDRTETTAFVVYPNAEKNFANMLDCVNNSPFLWAKMIRRKFWLSTQAFAPKEISYCEDWYVTSRLYFYASKIVKVDKVLYHYVCSNSSAITYKRSEAHFKDLVLFWDTLDEFLKEQGVYEKYKGITNRSRVIINIRLMIEVNSYALLRKYVFMFHSIELKHVRSNQLRKGEKIMFVLLHWRLYRTAYVFLQLLHLKNKNN